MCLTIEDDLEFCPDFKLNASAYISLILCFSKTEVFYKSVLKPFKFIQSLNTHILPKLQMLLMPFTTSQEPSRINFAPVTI